LNAQYHEAKAPAKVISPSAIVQLMHQSARARLITWRRVKFLWYHDSPDQSKNLHEVSFSAWEALQETPVKEPLEEVSWYVASLLATKNKLTIAQ
jgi:hypothetical protein